MRIRKKLPLVIFILISIPLIFLSVILYKYTSQSMINLNKNKMEQISVLASEGISTLINAQKREVELIGQLKDVIEFVKEESKNNGLELSEKVNAIISDRKSSSEGYRDVFIADKDGNIIADASSGVGKNLADRQYFKDAMSGKTTVSNIIISKVDGSNIIVIAAPVKNNEGKVIGVIGNSIGMVYFSEYVSKIEIENGGYAYLSDAEGRIISHPSEEKIGQLAENEKLKAVLASYDENNSNGIGVEKYLYRGTDKYMGYSVIPNVKWIVAVTENVYDMNREPRIVLCIILITAICVIIFAIPFVVEFSKSIIYPINELTKSMEKAADGNMDSECQYRAKNEFGELSTNFNFMLNRLNRSYEELTATYEELSATDEELRAQYSEIQDSEEALRNSEERYRLALDGANDAIWEWDFVNKSFFVSDKWSELTGDKNYGHISLKYILRNLIHPEDFSRVYMDLRSHLSGKSHYYKSEFRIKHSDGMYKWIFNRGKVLRNQDGKVIKLAGSITDISDRKEAEQQMLFMAYYDKLTGLPNKTYFMNELKNKLKKSRYITEKGAVFFIDLDNFKNVNDTLGHDYGDRLLEIVSEKMKGILSENDLVSRFGGDEFLILKPNIENRNDAKALAEQILNAFNSTYYINGKQLYITGSIGIAIYPDDSDDAGVLLKNADSAMYKAKELGKNKYMFFDEEIYSHLQRKIKIQNILHNAIENKELQVYYQAQYHVETDRICGFEALLRLNNSELGFIPPNEFISIAEETGLISEIGEWCFRKVCEDNMLWRLKGYDYDFIAINISSVQLQQIDFIQTIETIIEETGTCPSDIEIEITETALIKSIETGVKKLNILKNKGIRIAIDDFGTGYSSLNYLGKIPFDVLKIDKYFVDGVGNDLKQEAIVDGVIKIAHKMNLQIVAEGVETKQQFELLKSKGCDKIQGYLISRPVPRIEAEKLFSPKLN